MEFGWLQQASIMLIAAVPFGLGTPATRWLAALSSRRSCWPWHGLSRAGTGVPPRRARSGCAARRRSLKEQLRLRLSEPAILNANGIGAAPTMGASEAFEGDIEAAARSVLHEAGGNRAKAKELLRRRTNGHGAANGKLNGSEAGYWRQLGALSLLDNTQDALAAYGRAADLAPTDAETQMLAGVLNLRTGNLAAAENAFRRQIDSVAPTVRASCATGATPCWAMCTPRARSTMRRWRPTPRPSAR